jgi:lysophospholipase L1-like esterase
MTAPKKNRWKNFTTVCFGIFLGLLLCEIILRIYNPFPFALKRGKLVLPSNIKTEYNNKWISKLDPVIYFSKNSLGFRGPEPNGDIDKLHSIIVVGGSTTECRFLSDSLTWPAQLATNLNDSISDLWLNNAGLDGHSTFGHLLLTKDYLAKLKPRFVIFLTGINDVETERPELFDLMNENKINFRSFKSFLKSAANKTETGSTILNFLAIKKAWKKGLIHKEVNFAKLGDTVLTQIYIDSMLKKQDLFLAGYKSRIDSLIKLCRQNNMEPIWITQPSLYGDYTDPDTKLNMKNKKVPGSSPVTNYELADKILEKYNDVVRSFGNEIKVVDLAKQMPKQTSLYYDNIHFTNKGAEAVGKIIAADLSSYLKNKFNE